MVSNVLNHVFFAIGMPGTGELVIILVIVLVLFGGAKIPDIAKNLGKGLKEFKKAISGGGSDSDPSDKTDTPSKP